MKSQTRPASGLFKNINSHQEFACFQWRGTLDSLSDIAAWMGAMPYLAKLPGVDGYSLILPDKAVIGETAGQDYRFEISKIVYPEGWICWRGNNIFRVVDKERFDYDFKPLRVPF